MTVKQLRTLSACGVVAATVVLAACNNDGPVQYNEVYLTPAATTDGGNKRGSRSEASRTGAPAAPVDPKNFEIKGMSVFNYTVDGYKGTCAVSKVGVSCTGKTPKDAPEVTAVPHPPKKADAIYAGEDGLHYTVFTGMPGTRNELQHGQSIKVGDHRCEFLDESILECRSARDSFTISGPDGAIDPSRKPDTPPMFTAADAY